MVLTIRSTWRHIEGAALAWQPGWFVDSTSAAAAVAQLRREKE
jgi:hypothetical protein